MFEKLALETVEVVLGFVDLEALCAFAQVSKFCRDVCGRDSLWKPLWTRMAGRQWEEDRRRRQTVISCYLRNLEIATLTGKRIFINEFDACQTVQALKLCLEDRSGVPWHQQRLLCSSVEMQDSMPVKRYNIRQNEGMIQMVLRIGGSGDVRVPTCLTAHVPDPIHPPIPGDGQWKSAALILYPVWGDFSEAAWCCECPNTKLRALVSEAGIEFGTSLQVSDFSLQRVPFSVFVPSNITVLSLANNDLSDLPRALACLWRLDTIDLSQNKFETVPEVLSLLGSLRRVVMKENALTTVPSLASLPRLRELDLQENMLSGVGDVASAAYLEALHLKGNALKAFPRALLSMTHLTTLGLENTGLTTLPNEVALLLTSLTRLGLHGNPLETELAKLWEDGRALTCPTQMFVKPAPQHSYIFQCLEARERQARLSSPVKVVVKDPAGEREVVLQLKRGDSFGAVRKAVMAHWTEYHSDLDSPVIGLMRGGSCLMNDTIIGDCLRLEEDTCELTSKDYRQ